MPTVRIKKPLKQSSPIVLTLPDGRYIKINHSKSDGQYVLVTIDAPTDIKIERSPKNTTQ